MTKHSHVWKAKDSASKNSEIPFHLPPPLHALGRRQPAHKAHPPFRAAGETRAGNKNRKHLKLSPPYTLYRSWRVLIPSPKQTPQPWQEHRPHASPHATSLLFSCCRGSCRLLWVFPTPVVPAAQPQPSSAPQPTPAERQKAIRGNYATTPPPSGLHRAHLSFIPPLLLPSPTLTAPGCSGAACTWRDSRALVLPPNFCLLLFVFCFNNPTNQPTAAFLHGQNQIKAQT